MISRDIRDTIDTQHDTLPNFSDESRSLASAQDFKQSKHSRKDEVYHSGKHSIKYDCQFD